jgi:hypothetical protein
MKRAAEFFDVIERTPGAVEHVTELSYHRYRGVSPAALSALVERAERHGLRTAMLEHIGADHDELYEDLTAGRNSAWSQYALAFCREGDRGGIYYTVDDSDPANPTITAGSRTPYLAQYFRHIRRGAVRLGAAASGSGYGPVAFRNADGTFAVVVKAERGGPVAIIGRPAGRYGIHYTTKREAAGELTDLEVASGDTLRADLPAAGVMAVFGRQTATADGEMEGR